MDSQSSRHHNNCNLLRLIFAGLVVVSHSPVLVDGNHLREPLLRLFGRMSLGDVSVDGFFLVSGYLITKSFARQPKVFGYLMKRVARIYPAYLICYWLCILALAPFVGGDRHLLTSPHFLLIEVLRSLCLFSPQLPGAFHSLPFAFLNGSVWTIKFEFLCYLLVALLGPLVIKLRSRDYLRYVLCVFVLLGLVLDGYARTDVGADLIPGGTISSLIQGCLRFFPICGAGALFYFFRHEIRFTGRGTAVAMLGLLVFFSFASTQEPALVVFGGYLIFGFSFAARVLTLGEWTGKTDISYGLYLYAWPIQNLLIWFWRDINPWVLSVIALLGAGLLGYCSWHLIEKKTLAIVHKRFSIRKTSSGSVVDLSSPVSESTRV